MPIIDKIKIGTNTYDIKDTTYSAGTKSDLIGATSSSTINKVWSAHILN